MKKIVAAFAAAVLALGFAGCSNDDTNDDSNNQTQTDNGDKKSGEKKSDKKSGDKKSDKKNKKEKKSSAAKELSTKDFMATYGPKQNFKQVHVVTKMPDITLDQKVDMSTADQKVHTVLTTGQGKSEMLQIGSDRWVKMDGQWQKAKGITMGSESNSSKDLFELMKDKGNDTDILKLTSDKDGLLVYEGTFDGESGSFTLQSDTGYVTNITTFARNLSDTKEKVEIIQDQFNVDPGIKIPA